MPTDTTADAAPQLERYAALLRPEAERPGLTLPAPDWQDTDHWQDKLALLLSDPVAVVSFHFGCPPEPLVQQLHDVGTRVLVSATTPDEAVAAQGVGADAVCLQAATAGGHRGTHTVAAAPNDLDAAGAARGRAPARQRPAGGGRRAGHQPAGPRGPRRRRSRRTGRNGPAAHPRGRHP